MVFPWMAKEASGCVPDVGDEGENGTLPGNDKLRLFLDRLQSAEVDIELPQIAVMGDTSSGKSSLLSNISMIELPSSSKLTTRCPIRLHMTRASERKATVSIQWKSLTDQDVHERSTSDWSELTQLIADAQNKIIEVTKKEVAPDIVSVEIQDPACTNLTLIDLPGLVRTQAHDESEELVADIQNLMKEYLENPRCVILAVVPANNDFHNSQVMADARKVDPNTSRTIPVITKPDLIDKGAEQDVLELLMNQKVSFDLGFHMIKGRGQAAMDQKRSISEGLAEEEAFFRSIEPWASVENRALFGTVSLRHKLGELQMQMIREEFPKILDEINSRRQEAMKLLEKMGDIHSTNTDRRRYFQDVCQSLVGTMKSSLSGRGKNGKKPSAAAKLHEICDGFVEKICHGSLGSIGEVVEGAMVIVTSPRGSVRGEVVHCDETFACVDYVEEKDRTSNILFDQTSIPSTDSVIKENYVWSDGSKIFIGRKGNCLDLMRKIPLSHIRSDPSWLKEKIAENRTDDLACFLNVDIFKNIIEDFIEEDWKPHCNELLRFTRQTLWETLQFAIADALSTDRYPRLREIVESECRSVANDLMQEAERQLNAHLDLEKHPYTHDPTLFENIAEARNRALKQDLYTTLRLEQEGVFDTSAIRDLIDEVLERQKLKPVEDVLAEEMEHVLASYGEVSTRRVIDRAPMICWEVFRTIASKLQDSLWSITDDTLLESMRESSEFAKRHETLRLEVERMNRALSIFEAIS